MIGWESRRTRRSGRDRRRPELSASVENLEGRQLLAYNSLGFSLPDLVVDGFAAPVAAWGGPLAISADVKNIGSTTTIEPLALAPGAPSTSDAPAFKLDVYAVPTYSQFSDFTPRHHQIRQGFAFAEAHPLIRDAVKVGEIDVPAIRQNNLVQVTETINLPDRPAGFPDTGTIGIYLVVSPTSNFLESDTTNNVSPVIPVALNPPLPAVEAVGLDLPPVMQPGDTVLPVIRIANLGTVNTDTQGPFVVQFVASTTPDFNEGVSVIATSPPITSLNPLSVVPSRNGQLGFEGLQPLSDGNTLTFSLGPVTLPVTPSVYYVGVVVDPTDSLQELSGVVAVGTGAVQGGHHARVPHGRHTTQPATRVIPTSDVPTLALATQVGPPIDGLPPAGVNVAGGAANIPVFPYPFGGNPVGGLPDGSAFPAPFPPATYITLARQLGYTDGTGSDGVVTTFGQRGVRLASATRRMAPGGESSPQLQALAARRPVPRPGRLGRAR